MFLIAIAWWKEGLYAGHGKKVREINAENKILK